MRFCSLARRLQNQVDPPASPRRIFDEKFMTTWLCPALFNVLNGLTKKSAAGLR
jgi:hypothetical protein